jgi:hypothetical protein
VHHSWHHDGILVLTLEADNNVRPGSSNRKITVRTTASFLVIGHTRGDIGKVVMLRLSDSIKPLASVGLEIFTTEGLWEAADFEWCSGLQIKWQPHTAKNGRMSVRWGRNKVIEGRKTLGKNNLTRLDVNILASYNRAKSAGDQYDGLARVRSNVRTLSLIGLPPTQTKGKLQTPGV